MLTQTEVRSASSGIVNRWPVEEVLQKSATHVSAEEYREALSRVSSRAAMKMLRDTDYSIVSIAAALGYSSQTAFAAAFRKLTGESPTDWRRRMGEHPFPNVKMEEDLIFIIDGNVWTSAGMTAGIDLALAMAEKDLGADAAHAIAQKLVVFHRRAGGQSQHSALLELEAKSDRIQNALAYAKKNLHTPLSVERLAEAAHLSPRQFSRAFRAETGQSPAKAVENLRLEAARMMMEQTRHPIDVVARDTGFGDRRRLRQAFLRNFGQPPQTIRRNARAETAA
jgi:transcriptional regulator GlxA family with amidase domain